MTTLGSISKTDVMAPRRRGISVGIGENMNASNTNARTTTNVLVVEDAPEYRQMIEAVLGRESGYKVVSCADGESALALARAFDPDVVVLDLGLPDLDGIEVCRQLRTFTTAYIIMLTARDEEVDRLVGLAVGADDYMTKPFSLREFAARVQVLLRRPRGGLEQEVTNTENLDLGRLTLNIPLREVRFDGEIVELTKI